MPAHTAVLAEGAEARIRAAAAAHPGCHDVANAALRDLGCKFEACERWTGSAGLGPEVLVTAEDDAAAFL